MESRDSIFARVRAAIGRKPGQKPLPPPEPLLRIRHRTVNAKLVRFRDALQALNGTVTFVPNPIAARQAVELLLAGRSAVASNHPFLIECGVPELAGVNSAITDPQQLRDACSTSTVGITSAYCLLAETGSIVLRSSIVEPRLVSLLPPVHIAVVPVDRLLSNLDEMLSMLPRPVAASSAMVIITGPSRTGDIEQFLVRGVHGPGDVHVVIVLGKNLAD